MQLEGGNTPTQLCFYSPKIRRSSVVCQSLYESAISGRPSQQPEPESTLCLLGSASFKIKIILYYSQITNNRFLNKLNELSYDSAILLIGVCVYTYTKEWKTCAQIFRGALFTTGKGWKHQCLLTGERRHKHIHTCSVTLSYKGRRSSMCFYGWPSKLWLLQGKASVKRPQLLWAHLLDMDVYLPKDHYPTHWFSGNLFMRTKKMNTVSLTSFDKSARKNLFVCRFVGQQILIEYLLPAKNRAGLQGQGKRKQTLCLPEQSLQLRDSPFGAPHHRGERSWAAKMALSSGP